MASDKSIFIKVLIKSEQLLLNKILHRISAKISDTFKKKLRGKTTQQLFYSAYFRQKVFLPPPPPTISLRSKSFLISSVVISLGDPTEAAIDSNILLEILKIKD